MSELPPSYAEYPRPSQPYGRGPGVYFDAISEAWQMVRSDFGPWVAGTLIFLVLLFALGYPVGRLTASMNPTDPYAGDFWSRFLGAFAVRSALNVVPTAISNMMMAGLVGMGVRQLRGEPISVSMMFDPFRRFLPNFGTSLICSIIFLVSTFACLIPALFFVPVFMLAPTVGFLKELSPSDALSTTFNMCKGYWIGLLGLTFVAGIIAALGVCACGIGLLFTYPIYFGVLAIHYRAFFEPSYGTPG